MKKKTARRFLRRNEIKMIAARAGMKQQSPHFFRRWMECIRTLVKEG